MAVSIKFEPVYTCRPEPKEPKTKAEEEGWEARVDGKNLWQDNPYDRETQLDEYIDWRTGWCGVWYVTRNRSVEEEIKRAKETTC